MITGTKNMEEEILSLASSIKRNVVDPAGHRLENLEFRVAAAERNLVFLTRSFFAACAAFAVVMISLACYLAG